MKTIKKIKILKTAVLLMALTAVFSLSMVTAAGRSKETTDAAYANFRNVRAGSIGRNNLFRSQHPANGSSRALCANMLAGENGIQTVLNLSDSEKTLQRYFKKEKISPTYYYKTLFDQGKVYTVQLHPYHHGSSYQRKVADGLKFFTNHEGPYLVHCEVGRDRTGFVILLLESLMNAPYEYIVDDFAQTYVNRNDSYEQAREKAVRHTNEDFSYMTGKNEKTDWSNEDLAGSAEKYLLTGGMTSIEISTLKRNLSASYSYDGAAGNMLVSYPKEDDARKQGAVPAVPGDSSNPDNRTKTGLKRLPTGRKSSRDGKEEKAPDSASSGGTSDRTTGGTTTPDGLTP